MSDENIDIQAFMYALQRWWWLVVLGPVAVGLAAVGLGLSFSIGPTSGDQSRVYEASAIVSMGESRVLDGVSDLITAGPVLEGVIDDLGLSLTVPQLRNKVSGSHIKDSSLVRITAKDSNRALAINLANEVAQEFVEYFSAFQKQQLAISQQELSRSLSELGFDPSDSSSAELAAYLQSLVKLPGVVTPAEVMNDLESVEAASVPSNNVLRNFFLGIFLGGVLSVMSAIGLEYLKNPVGSPARLESKFSLTPLGTLPRWRKRRNQLEPRLVTDKTSPALMEMTRQLATNVGLTINERNINTLAVVSPDVGDGRTRLASNLAVALADTWKDVVLVDADLRCPSLHHQFNADNTVGLSDFLSNSKLEAGSIIQDTRHKRLKVIPSGPVPENPVELLSSPRMRWLLGHLKETADIVLVDTPPLLVVTDGVLVSSQVEGALLVVNGRNSRVGTLKAAVANLEKAGTPILGYVWVGMISELLSKYFRSRRYYRRLGDALRQKEAPGDEKLKVMVQPHSNGTEVSQTHSPAS